MKKQFAMAEPFARGDAEIARMQTVMEKLGTCSRIDASARSANRDETFLFKFRKINLCITASVKTVKIFNNKKERATFLKTSSYANVSLFSVGEHYALRFPDHLTLPLRTMFQEFSASSTYFFVFLFWFVHRHSLHARSCCYFWKHLTSCRWSPSI